MTTRELSKLHETAVAKALGMRRTANSGATDFSKGDVIGSNAIVECKTKMAEVKAFTVYREWLDVLEEERRGMSKEVAALAISFDSGLHSYYVIDEKTMRKLLRFIDEATE